jgi:branched-chain amino acid transport system substrate-binding protein
MGRRWLVGLVAVGVVAVSAGCGSDNSGGSSAATSAAATSATSAAATTAAAAGAATSAGGAATGTPVKIGFICSCTGPLASSVAISQPAYDSWVKAQNAKGGLNGHPIDLIVKDDASNPGNSVAMVHELVEQDNVIALVDISNADQAWADYVTSKNIPVVGGNVSSLLLFTNPLFFSPGQTTDSLPVSVMTAAKKAGASKVAVVYCAESPICQQLVDPTQKAATQVGVTISYITGVPAAAPNYTAQCVAAQQSGATAFFVAHAVSVVQAVADSCTKQGYKPTFIAQDGAVAQSFTTSPGLSDGFLGVQTNLPFSVTDTPEAQRMIAAFKQYNPSLLTDPNYNEIAVEEWASGLMLELAAARGNFGANGSTPTSQQLLDGLHTFNKETLNGMAPGLTFKAGQPNPVPCWFWQGTKDGKFNLPYGPDPECAPTTS